MNRAAIDKYIETICGYSNITLTERQEALMREIVISFFYTLEIVSLFDRSDLPDAIRQWNGFNIV